MEKGKNVERETCNGKNEKRNKMQDDCKMTKPEDNKTKK